MAKQGTSGKKSVWLWVALLVAVAVVAGIALWAVFTFVLQRDVVVPDVIGTPEAAARALLLSKGLETSTTQAFDTSVAAGSVVSQSPKPGSTARSGTKVNLVISKGAQDVEVPNVVSMTSDDAAAKLKDAGLAVGDIIRQYNTKVEQDAVIRQDPAAGSKLPKGEAVDLFVSKGAKRVSVPNVVGKTLAEARRTLTGVGLYAHVQRQPSSQESPGTVMSQTPVAQNQVLINTSVTLVVSSGPSRVTVPDVVGLSAASARTKLRNLGLVVQIEEVPDPSTKVVKQVPPAGTTVRVGAPVKLLVGDGSGAP